MFTQREMASEVVYKQNRQDCSVAVLYGVTADIESERFEPIKAFDKSTGEFKCEVYVNARTIN